MTRRGPKRPCSTEVWVVLSFLTGFKKENIYLAAGELLYFAILEGGGHPVGWGRVAPISLNNSCPGSHLPTMDAEGGAGARWSFRRTLKAPPYLDCPSHLKWHKMAGKGHPRPSLSPFPAPLPCPFPLPTAIPHTVNGTHQSSRRCKCRGEHGEGMPHP